MKENVQCTSQIRTVVVLMNQQRAYPRLSNCVVNLSSFVHLNCLCFLFSPSPCIIIIIIHSLMLMLPNFHDPQAITLQALIW